MKRCAIITDCGCAMLDVLVLESFHRHIGEERRDDEEDGMRHGLSFSVCLLSISSSLLLFYIRESRIFSIISGVYLIIPSLKSEAIHC